MLDVCVCTNSECTRAFYIRVNHVYNYSYIRKLEDFCYIINFLVILNKFWLMLITDCSAILLYNPNGLVGVLGAPSPL